VAAIKMLTDRDIRVEPTYIITRDNFSDRHNVIQMMNAMNVEYTATPVIFNRVNGDSLPLKYRINSEEMEQVMIENIYHPVNNRCNAARARFRVNAIGKVYPCEFIRYEVGDLRKSTFTEILNSKELSQIRDMDFNHIDACKDCAMIANCPNCAGLAYLETGKLGTVSKESCRLASIYYGLLDQGRIKIDNKKSKVE
jgi:radical SAM protein with 4Fe4S-binding SPASM domain